jgi:hypothetical protein
MTLVIKPKLIDYLKYLYIVIFWLPDKPACGYYIILH